MEPGCGDPGDIDRFQVSGVRAQDLDFNFVARMIVNTIKNM
jgi:hypothetical protein